MRGQQPMTSHSVVRRSRSRMMVVMCALILLYAVVVGRMVDLTMDQGSFLNTKFYQGPEKSLLGIEAEKANGRRANIYDRNGILLATSLESWSVYADPKVVLDPVEAATKISKTLPSVDYGQALRRLQSKSRFVWLKRNVTPQQMHEVNALGLPGVQFLKEEKRVYPHGPLVSHILGYSNIDNEGVMGIEKSFDQLLKEDQKELSLSLDVRIQNALKLEMERSIKEFKAEGGAGVVMDVNTGEILALVSLPDFDPHNPGDSPIKNQYNRATLGVYELGSIFKVFTTAAYLKENPTSVRDVLDARTSIKRAGFTINDFHAEKRKMNVAEILIHSSNIGSALMAEKIGTDEFRRFFADLGIFDKLDLEINEVGKPLIPYPWRDINTLTASYGHGLAISPLHASTAMAAMVNGGYRVRPTLLLKPKGFEPYKEQVMSETTSDMVNDLLRLIVSHGTGKNANVPGYRVGGKTGTAEKPGKDGYKESNLISSFMATFPTDDPQYVVMVMIDEPVGNKRTYGYATGGWVAAPVVGNVIRAIASVKDMEPAFEPKLDQMRRQYKVKLEKEGRLASF